MKKSRRILSIILTALMVVTMLPLSVMPASASAAADLTVTIDTGASVTLKDTDADGYYDIGTADELYAFAAAINSGKDGVNGELTANIVVNKNVLTANGDLNGNGSDFRVWTPIGYEVSSADREYFEGLFDGNNYTISGLYYNGSAMLVGLFGYGYGATIRNVGIIDSYMCSNYSDTSSRGYIGGVAATFNYDGVSMENCYNKGTIIATTDRVYAGGVVGNIYSIEKISNSYNTGKVVGKSYVGGVVGCSTYSSLIDCYNTGDISGDEYVGGIAGYASLGKNYVEKCYNTGNINCTGNYAGGIIAYLSGSYSTSYDRAITKCYNTGNINSSGNYVGGLAGRSDSYKSIIRNSYNVGDVSGIKYVGGIVGENSYFVQNCYNLGDVSGTSYVGGVSGGKVGNNSAIQNCYYLTDTATGGIGGLDAVGEAEVKTAEQFASGEIAYLLQGEQTEQVWGQSIGSDTLPVFATESNKVYFVSNCQNDTGYSNTQNEEGGHIVGDLATCKTQAVCAVCGTSYGELDPDNHEYETNNGICCDTYQSAALNAEGFYEIFNAGQLYWFAQQVNIAGDTAANGKLMADIDLENRTWYPIGVYNDAVNAGGTTAKVLFKGIFDGNGHTVSNFTATGTGSQGLVGYSDTTVVVKNLGVINATVSGWNAGAVLAYQGTVENCYAINCKVTGYTTATDAEGVFAGAVAGSQTPYAKYCFAYNCQVIAGTGMTATLAPVGGERVGNSYYSNVTAKNGTFRSYVGETAKTAEQFASGEVAYLLGSAWGQTIGTDSYPVPGGDKVYYGYTSCGDVDKVYTNDETVYETKPEHNFDSKGFCTECENEYQPAELKDGYYQIANAGQLFWFAKYINTVDRTASAVLVDDIDLENRPWSPIGFTSEKSNNFRGHFDGQGHTITGLYVEGDRAGLGFFGEVRTGTVENFTIYGEVVVNKEYNYVGGVIGSACGLNSSDHGLERNGATIRNITSYVNLTAGAHGIGMVGGFIGYANHETLIENCSWYGNFDAGIYRVDSGAGGFIGRIYDSASVTIRNCAAYGTITTEYKSGTFESKDDIYIGGFLSYSPSGAQTVMENNLWAGRITNNTNLSAENAHLSAYGTLTSFKSVTNCYMEEGSAAYITTSNVNTDGITTVTAAQLKSGEIAYLLQGEQTEEVWGQTIGTDDYPVLGGDKVYYVYASCSGTEMMYTNTSAEKPAHNYINGFCINCDSYEPAVLNGDVYEISNAGQLYWFAAVVNTGYGDVAQNAAIHGKLTADIVINKNVIVDGELASDTSGFRIWNRMGEESNPYIGTFDGDGKTISGLYFNDIKAANYRVGLFGYVGENGIVQNVNVVDSYIGAYKSVGGLAGVNSGTVMGCTFDGILTAKITCTGGIVASNIGTITNCSNSGTIISPRYSERVGGITGENSGTVTDCYNTGTVSGYETVGGIVGFNLSNGQVENCSNSGTIISLTSSKRIGGITGENSGTVTDCYNTGTVSGDGMVGGIAGANDSGGQIENCWNNASVSGDGNIGGVLGRNEGSITACYSSGTVSGTSSLGGVVGYCDSSRATYCYFNNNKFNGKAANIGTFITLKTVEGKTTAQFASGEVAYLLQGEQTEQVWGQTIGTDDYPVLGGAKVYQVTNCKDEAAYSNTNENIGHSYENGTCTVCGTTVFSLINGAAFDSTDSYIYGFAPGITSLDDYTEILVDGYEWTYTPGQFGGFGTGTKAILKNGEEIVAEYIVLIYGDLNGDGWYDADDAFLTNLIVAGLLTQENLPDYMWKAADCNHDGEINETDVDLLMGAGVKLNDIDQNAALSELAAQSAYIEYMSIIDQSAGLEVEDTAPETNETVEGTDFGIFLAQIFLFIRKIFNFVFSFVIK